MEVKSCNKIIVSCEHKMLSTLQLNWILFYLLKCDLDVIYTSKLIENVNWTSGYTDACLTWMLVENVTTW